MYSCCGACLAFEHVTEEFLHWVLPIVRRKKMFSTWLEGTNRSNGNIRSSRPNLHTQKEKKWISKVKSNPEYLILLFLFNYPSFYSHLYPAQNRLFGVIDILRKPPFVHSEWRVLICAAGDCDNVTLPSWHVHQWKRTVEHTIAAQCVTHHIEPLQLFHVLTMTISGRSDKACFLLPLPFTH